MPELAGPTENGPPYDPAVALARVQATGPVLLKACKAAFAYECGGCADREGPCKLPGVIMRGGCPAATVGNMLREAIAEAEEERP